MIEIGFEFIGLPRVDAGFAQLERRLDSLRPLWERFRTEFHTEESALFAAAPWTPLSEPYATRKAQRYSGLPILQATQTLMKSLTQSSVEGAVERISDLEAEFGTDVDYAAFHQFGTNRMPARPPLADPDERAYSTIAGQYVEELIAQAGFN